MGPRLCIAIGMALLALAGGLAAVGQHDGLVGTTPPDTFPAPGQAPTDVTTRLVVDRTLSPDDPLRAAMDASGQATLAQAHFDGPDGGLRLVVVFPGPAPTPGTVIVVEGSVRTVHSEGATVIRLDAESVREPLVFKKA